MDYTNAQLAFAQFLLLLAVVIVAVPYIVYNIHRAQKMGSPAIRERAEKDGYVCDATLISCRNESYERDWEDKRGYPRRGAYIELYKAKYEYVVDGEQYEYQVTLQHVPPTNIKLYYPSGDPNKVYAEQGWGYSEAGRIPPVLGTFLMIAAVVAVYRILLVFAGF